MIHSLLSSSQQSTRAAAKVKKTRWINTHPRHSYQSTRHDFPPCLRNAVSHDRLSSWIKRKQSSWYSMFVPLMGSIHERDPILGHGQSSSLFLVFLVIDGRCYRLSRSFSLLSLFNNFAVILLKNNRLRNDCSLRMNFERSQKMNYTWRS